LSFCETKLTTDIQHLFNVPNYNAYTNNLSRQSGGVALYVRNWHDSQLRPELTIMEHCLETLFIEIKNQEVNLVVGVVYRRPHTDFKHFLDKMKKQ